MYTGITSIASQMSVSSLAIGIGVNATSDKTEFAEKFRFKKSFLVINSGFLEFVNSTIDYIFLWFRWI